MKSILIIEKNGKSSQYFDLLSKNMNVYTLMARDFIETEEILSNIEVDLIIIDSCQDENSDSIEITKKIKRIAPSVPIVIKSTSALPNTIIQSFYAGCDDYILKPFSIDTIQKMIEKYSGINGKKQFIPPYHPSDEKAYCFAKI